MPPMHEIAHLAHVELLTPGPAGGANPAPGRAPGATTESGEPR